MGTAAEGNRKCTYWHQGIFGNWFGERNCLSVVDLEMLVSKRRIIGTWELNKSYAFRYNSVDFQAELHCYI